MALIPEEDDDARIAAEELADEESVADDPVVEDLEDEDEDAPEPVYEDRKSFALRVKEMAEEEGIPFETIWEREEKTANLVVIETPPDGPNIFAMKRYAEEHSMSIEAVQESFAKNPNFDKLPPADSDDTPELPDNLARLQAMDLLVSLNVELEELTEKISECVGKIKTERYVGR